MIDLFQGTGVPLTSSGINGASRMLGIQNDVESLWSILSVETRGFGYLSDKRPKILFERHIFHKRTGGRFDADYPDISNPKAGGYSGGAAEYGRLIRAMALARTAALESASWGLGQIMGFNATSLGYDDAQDMVDQFKSGEDAQLEGCARYLAKNPPLLSALVSRDWPRVAFYYNGANYAINSYDTKLREAHANFAKSLPDADLRANQVRLLYAGFDPRGIDGFLGSGTKAAIRAFETSRKLNVTGGFGEETVSALKAAAGI